MKLGLCARASWLANGRDAHATKNGRWSRYRAELGGSSVHCTSVYAIQRWGNWSGRRDLHPRYPAPKAGVLAATLRPG